MDIILKQKSKTGKEAFEMKDLNQVCIKMQIQTTLFIPKLNTTITFII